MGPTIVLRPVTDVIERNQDGIVQVYMDNPIANDVTLTVDANIQVPTGLHVYGQGFAIGGTAGVARGIFEVPPGTSRSIEVTIKADNTARIGSSTIKFSGYYWPGDNKDNSQQISYTYSVNVKEASKEPEKSPEEAAGFAGVLAVVSVLGAAYLLSRK